MNGKRSYTYPDGTTTPAMTADEAREAWFCPECGWFIGGFDDQEISLYRYGVCQDCLEQSSIENAEFDEGL